MGELKLSQFQRVGLLIAAILIAWLLWAQIDENGLDDTNWLLPILAIVAILLVATQGWRASEVEEDRRLANLVDRGKGVFARVAKALGRRRLVHITALLLVGALIVGLFNNGRALFGLLGATEAADETPEQSIHPDELRDRIRARALRREKNDAGMLVDGTRDVNAHTFFLQKFDDISIQLPKNWRWMGATDAAALNMNAEAMADALEVDAKQGNNDVLIAGNAFDDAEASVASIRLSVRQGGAPSQAEMQQALQKPQGDVAPEIIAEAEKTASAMRRLPRTSYYRVVGGSFRGNGSLACLWTGFEYDVGKGPTISDTWVCPLGNRTLKLSTSYSKLRAHPYARTVDYVWRSLDAR